MVISTIYLFIYVFLIRYAIALAGRLWFLIMEPQVQPHETSCDIHDGKRAVGYIYALSFP